MTTIETPPPAAPEPAPPPRHRSGFYVAPWILAVLGGLALLVIGFGVGRAVDNGDGTRGRFFRGNGSAHPGLRLLILLILIALIVAAVVALVRHFSHRDAVAAATAAPVPPTAAATAEQVLADRFARGEIDEAEFVSRRNALRS
jgi:putative membrane protein